jgi:hypothetical protein
MLLQSTALTADDQTGGYIRNVTYSNITFIDTPDMIRIWSTFEVGFAPSCLLTSFLLSPRFYPFSFLHVFSHPSPSRDGSSLFSTDDPRASFCVLAHLTRGCVCVVVEPLPGVGVPKDSRRQFFQLFGKRYGVGALLRVVWFECFCRGVSACLCACSVQERISGKRERILGNQFLIGSIARYSLRVAGLLSRGPVHRYRVGCLLVVPCDLFVHQLWDAKLDSWAISETRTYAHAHMRTHKRTQICTGINLTNVHLMCGKGFGPCSYVHGSVRDVAPQMCFT